jgi:solute carrier family 13 (sodium-dependent dicarboxylate transporter), member 2/3/5
MLQRMTENPGSSRKPTPGGHSSLRRRAGLLTGLAVFAALRFLPPPVAMSPEAWAVAALAALMALWWVSEAIPVPATALLPFLMLPLLGVSNPIEAAAPYGNPLIFLFLGGFLIALSVQRWGLHKRLALALLRRVGTGPHALVAGFLVVAASLSMWLSNTATSIVLLPVALSVATLVRHGGADNMDSKTRTAVDAALLLAIAYGANIGGLATLIGTPPNALLAGFLLQSSGYNLGFARWMLFALPLSAILLALAWLVLTRLAFRIPTASLPGARAAIDREFAALGPVSGPEIRVATVFVMVAVAWLVRPVAADMLPDGMAVTDPAIALTGALALFLLPSGRRDGERLLDWRQTRRLPWGILVLFGGGLSLAAAIGKTGLAAWIADTLAGQADLPIGVIVTGTTGIIILLTELTSNTATAATFLPLVTELAVRLGHNPLLLAIPAALAASCAFMLPVATPPNAIVYGSGRITMGQMAWAGIWLNVLATALIVVAAFVLLPLVFDLSVTSR